MAGSVNKVILVGHLGRDPEIRSTQDGREIANLTIATSESWRDKGSGERREKSEWHRVVIFSEGLVNVAKNYLRKGSKVYLEGQLQTRKWTDQQGVEKFSTEVVLQGFNAALVMLDGPQKQDKPESYSAPAQRVADYDDEIPFAIALALGVGFAATQFFANGGAQWIA
jgi:single-strand DNA-binding protein